MPKKPFWQKVKKYQFFYASPKWFCQNLEMCVDIASNHTQLRLGRSQLNDHLFSVRLSPTTKCLCGNLETTEHFLHDCFLYDVERKILHSELPGVLEKRLDKYSRRELTHILLYGEYSENPEKYQHNKILFCDNATIRVLEVLDNSLHLPLALPLVTRHAIYLASITPLHCISFFCCT